MIHPSIWQSVPMISGHEISDAWLEELRSPGAGADRAPHARVEKEPEFTGGFHQGREISDIAEKCLKHGCFT